MSEFTQNWFEITAKANFETFFIGYKGKQNLNFLEIGCFEGMATRWMLENILTDVSSRITVIDTFGGSIEHKEAGIELAGMLDRFKENTKEWENQIIMKKGNSQEILRTLPPTNYDCIYVDGSHRASDALQDIILSWQLLKPGGLMIMDDYAWNNFTDNLNACIAIDAFLNCFKDKYELLLKGYQVIIKKL